MTSCAQLGDDILADYVDGLLTAEQERYVERHLVACQQCLAVVREERELMAQLRNVRIDSQQHQQLVAGLLSLAGEEPVRPQQPSVRPAPAILTTHAPAQYCSARRSVAFTLAAVAGCLGAALTVTQVPGATAPASTGGGQEQQQSSLSRSVPAAWHGEWMFSRDGRRVAPAVQPTEQALTVDVASPR